MAFDFPELSQLKRLIERAQAHARIHTLAEVSWRKETYPIYAIEFGNAPKDAAFFAVIGGIHGLERIGTQVVNSYLHTVTELLHWDQMMQSFLEKVRLVFIPLVNPVGMLRRRRTNGNGVDLMRNAPVDSLESSWPVGGQRLTKYLPWYRGKKGAPMETESIAVLEYLNELLSESSFGISVDVHSGFGLQDRIWFPYAKTRKLFHSVAEVVALREFMRRTLPHHVYIIEPQSLHYRTHGDLWDYLYDQERSRRPEKVYLPFSLEMGSWIWAKKNPMQLFNILGAFNPMEPHRKKRILRRHLMLFDFFLRVTASPEPWLSYASSQRRILEKRAVDLWHSPLGDF